MKKKGQADRIPADARGGRYHHNSCIGTIRVQVNHLTPAFRAARKGLYAVPPSGD